MSPATIAGCWFRPCAFVFCCKAYGILLVSAVSYYLAYKHQNSWKIVTEHESLKFQRRFSVFFQRTWANLPLLMIGSRGVFLVPQNLEARERKIRLANRVLEEINSRSEWSFTAASEGQEMRTTGWVFFLMKNSKPQGKTAKQLGNYQKHALAFFVVGVSLYHDHLPSEAASCRSQKQGARDLWAALRQGVTLNCNWQPL